MKAFLSILFSLASLVVLSQDKNEMLLKAITKDDKEAVYKLIEDGADVNYVKSVGSWMKMNPLLTAIYANQFDISVMLIEKKADVNWKDGFKTSAIMYAASAGDQRLVELLLKNGANINDNDGQGNTVLTAAEQSKNNDLIKFVKDKLNK